MRTISSEMKIANMHCMGCEWTVVKPVCSGPVVLVVVVIGMNGARVSSTTFG